MKNKEILAKECLAGVTSFFAAVYIIVVNASILKDSGIPMEAGIIATALTCAISCIIVGLFADVPLVVIPGMGINALFTYTVVNTLGLTYQQGFAVVIVAGFIFLILTLTGVAKVLMQAIPKSLKEAIGVGIGIFITFIGLQKGGLVVPNSTTFVSLGNFSDPKVLLTIITLIVMLFLFLKGIKGDFLIGMIIGGVVAVFLGVIQLKGINLEPVKLEAYKGSFFSPDFSAITSIKFWIAVFSLTLVITFENLSLVYNQVIKMIASEEKYERAIKSVAFTTMLSGFLGTSPTVSSVEGAAGIASGAKTGKAAIVTGLLFLVALFFMPFIKLIPDSAIAPVLLIIGCLMMSGISEIDLSNFEEAFPAFLVIVMIPLTFSIVDGMAFGFIAYPLVKLFKGKVSKVKLPMFAISIMFLVNFVLHAM